jgi:hypothetical protein
MIVEALLASKLACLGQASESTIGPVRFGSSWRIGRSQLCACAFISRRWLANSCSQSPGALGEDFMAQAAFR